MGPRVSVLMPVYNGMPYVREAVRSILTQDMEDLELVMVDDASTDGSAAWLQACDDPRIRLVRNDRNMGQARSLNRGLAVCRAPYVARLDQDDMCLASRLRTQAAWLDRRTEVAVVGTFASCVDADGRDRGRAGRRLDNYGAFVGSLLLGRCPLGHTSVMFRRAVIQELGGYDPSFAPADDVELWVRLALGRYGAEVIPKRLSLYRVHASQQSATCVSIHRANVRRAQARLIEAFCPPGELPGVTRLLSFDQALWSEAGSRDQLVRIFRALGAMRSTIQSRLRLTTDEQAALDRVLDRWLGLGVRLAPRIARWPTLLFYPTVGVLSPLLVPAVRPALARMAKLARRGRALMGGVRING